MYVIKRMISFYKCHRVSLLVYTPSVMVSFYFWLFDVALLPSLRSEKDTFRPVLFVCLVLTREVREYFKSLIKIGMYLTPCISGNMWLSEGLLENWFASAWFHRMYCCHDVLRHFMPRWVYRLYIVIDVSDFYLISLVHASFNIVEWKHVCLRLFDLLSLEASQQGQESQPGRCVLWYRKKWRWLLQVGCHISFFCLTKGSEVTLPFLQLFSSVHFSYLRSLHWNYCVLDEGHIIKNGKTKVSGFEMVDIEDSHSTMETFKI